MNKPTKYGEWRRKALESDVCERCKRKTNLLTVDHILPLAIVEQLDLTGKDKYEDESNFQLICHPCNKFKGSRIDATDKRVIWKLKEYIKKLENREQ